MAEDPAAALSQLSVEVPADRRFDVRFQRPDTLYLAIPPSYSRDEEHERRSAHSAARARALPGCRPQAPNPTADDRVITACKTRRISATSRQSACPLLGQSSNQLLVTALGVKRQRSVNRAGSE